MCCLSFCNYLFKEKTYSKSDIEFLEISILNDSLSYSKVIIGEFETNKFKGFDTIIILLRKLGFKKLSIIISMLVLKHVLSILYNIFALL